MPSQELFDHVLKETLGWGTARHAWLVYGLVRWLQPKVVVETGALCGYMTLHILKGLEENGFGHVYAIDPFIERGSGAQLHNTCQRAGLSHRLTILDGRSEDVPWPSLVDMAVIDGDHSHEAVVYDCNQAVGRAASCLCLHDTYELSGPRDYVDRFASEAPEDWGLIEGVFDYGFSVFVKRGKPPGTGPEREYWDAREAAAKS